VLAYDKYKSGFDGDFGVEEVDFLQLCDDADVVSLHIPLTSETKGMIDAKWIGQFSQPFYLLNSARGGIAHTDAIVEALDTGSLLGAALDVLEFEMTSLEGISEKPPCFHQLVAHPKALLSPHVAGWSEESYFKLSDVLGDKILDKE
jgi:D-3-phosphoglycerate dehydrogenase